MQINYDRNAAEVNAKLAQAASFRAQYTQEQAAKRVASNRRFAAMVGLVFGLAFVAVDFMGAF